MEKQEDGHSNIGINKDEETRPISQDDKKQKKQPKKKRNLWSVKITVVSLFISAFISFLSELTASSEHIIVTIMLLFFLILLLFLFLFFLIFLLLLLLLLLLLFIHVHSFSKVVTSLMVIGIVSQRFFICFHTLWILL